ncbi:hypothetical protein [Microtetraspora malaysiensis]|uniref:hypothetical protein n=1 Tax=Microtetraspora malaysiensis TaxID=161358 RepID=UPI003D90A275
MGRFIGRQRDLGRLHRRLGKTADGGAIGRPGRALLLRGRRRVGKSRLVEEFVERSGVPHLFFTASGRPMGERQAVGNLLESLSEAAVTVG